MAKYEVVIKEIEIYVIKVDADSTEEAIEMAWEKLETGKGKYHSDSDSEAEACDY